MFALIRAIVLPLLIGLAWAAPSAAQETKTRWSCWLHDDGVQATCMVLANEREGRVGSVAPRLNRTLGLGPAEFLQTVRHRPAELRGRQIYVPLFTQPDDEARVAELVKAVLCGAQAQCEARYQHDMSRLFAHAPELFVDMNDLLWEGQNI